MYDRLFLCFLTRQGDGCSSQCTVETTQSWVCSGGSETTRDVCAICSDGVVAGAEVCDDRNLNNADGCSSICRIEVKCCVLCVLIVQSGWTCRPSISSNASSTSFCSPVCGDGLVRGGEACDDGNQRAGDGCSGNCAVETNFVCSTSSPSICRCSTNFYGASCSIRERLHIFVTLQCAQQCRLVPAMACVAQVANVFVIRITSDRIARNVVYVVF